MSRKKLTKTIWFGSEVDITGQPILPPIADNSNDLNGLHEGELYLHNADEMPSIWVRTKSGLIKSVTGSGNTPSFWELKTTDNGFNYLYTKLPVVTQYGVTMYKGESINLPSIYDGLPIDHDTIYWENGVLKAKGGGGGIESITKQMVIEALGFTPYSASNPNGYITAASIPSALKNPYALTFGSKTYDGSSAKEITASDLGAALSSDLSLYLPLTGGTLTSSNIPLVINKTSGAVIIGYNANGTRVGNLGFEANGNLTVRPNATSNSNYYSVYHSGNLIKLSQLTDDVVSGNYLPLSGGTLTGNLTLKTASQSSDTPKLYFQRGTTSDGYYDNYIYNKGGGIVFGYSSNGINYDLVQIGNTFFRPLTDNVFNLGTSSLRWANGYFSNLYVNDNAVWHSGNDGSGSGLDADTLDGVHASKLYQVNSAVDLGGTTANYDTLIVKYSNTSATSNHPYSIVGGDQCVALNLYAGTNYAAQLAVGFGTNYLAYRKKISSTSWQSWVKINAGLADEATKLQTARTIWGNTFDGSADVTGCLHITSYNGSYTQGIRINTMGGVSSIFFNTTNASGYDSGMWGITANANGNLRFRGGATSLSDFLVVTQGGNVGIGTPDPSAKLHVVGNILATGGVTMYSQRSLKNVVDERGLTLNELSAIKPTRYTWKDKRDDRLHFGGIADDIQQVLPEVVYKTEEGVLTMDYGNAGFAIASSLIKPVIDHEERIKALERENKELKEQIKQIKCA